MLGEKLRELREAKGLVQRQVAAALEVDTAYISKMESNEKPVSRQHLKKLSVLLGIAEDELLTLWLADKVYDVVKDEEVAIKAMHVAEDHVLKNEKQKRKELIVMSTYSIQDIIYSTDRHKLYTLMCSEDELGDYISWLHAKKIHSINVGKELAAFIDGLDDFSYLNIDVFDYAKKLLDKHKAKINNTGNDVVAVYNLGILLEPALELNATQLLKEFSKTAALIIIWENQSDISDRLHWSTQQNNIFLDFTETPLKKLQYAI